MKAIPRKQRERMARRDDILSAAEVIFAEHGFNGATIQEVARQAELSVGTVYNFFENKQDLFNKMMVNEAKRLHAHLRQAVAHAHAPAGCLIAYIRACMDYLSENLDLARLYVETVQATRFGLPAGLDEEGAKIDRQFELEVASWIAGGIHQGQIADLSPAAIVTLVNGMLNAVALKVLQEGTLDNLSHYTDACLSMVADGILTAAGRAAQHNNKDTQQP